MHNYLKASYTADAPGGVSGTFYSAEGISGSLLEEFSSITYDNGTHGTYNVIYPDAITPATGAVSVIRYKNIVTSNIGGVAFEGSFTDGTIPGKIVYMGFPFETIYPSYIQEALMDSILSFLYSEISVGINECPETPGEFYLAQNYPNPFNPSTAIRYHLPFNSAVLFQIFDLNGKIIRTWELPDQTAGQHQITWNGENSRGSKVSTGIYLYQLISSNFSSTRKMICLK